jgi:predicted DNA-binding transcriptional regulator AlpA
MPRKLNEALMILPGTTPTEEPITPPKTAFGPHELLVRSDLRALGIEASNPTLLLWEADGKFPKRLTLSAAKVAWLRHEVIAWIEAKAAARG